VEQRPSDYEVTPAVLERIERVHCLITANAGEFAEAGAKLDRNYSKTCIAAMAEEQREANEEAASLARASPGFVFPASVVRTTFADVIPSALIDVRADGWAHAALRWEVLLHNLIDTRIPATLPGADWELAADVLLAYWITCDARAESGPRVSEFQSWQWRDCPPIRRIAGTLVPDLRGANRAMARRLVSDWRRFDNAVDLALAVAKARRLDAGPPKTKHSKRKLTDEMLARALLMRQADSARSTASIAKELGLHPSTLSRSAYFKRANQATVIEPRHKRMNRDGRPAGQSRLSDHD